MEMVACFNNESIDWLSSEVRSGGLLRCVCSVRPNSYSMKMHRADVKLAYKEERAPTFRTNQPEWDFWLSYADGSAIRLKPNHSNT